MVHFFEYDLEGPDHPPLPPGPCVQDLMICRLLVWGHTACTQCIYIMAIIPPSARFARAQKFTLAHPRTAQIYWIYSGRRKLKCCLYFPAFSYLPVSTVGTFPIKIHGGCGRPDRDRLTPLTTTVLRAEGPVSSGSSAPQARSTSPDRRVARRGALALYPNPVGGALPPQLPRRAESQIRSLG